MNGKNIFYWFGVINFLNAIACAVWALGALILDLQDDTYKHLTMLYQASILTIISVVQGFVCMAIDFVIDEICSIRQNSISQLNMLNKQTKIFQETLDVMKSLDQNQSTIGNYTCEQLSVIGKKLDIKES